MIYCKIFIMICMWDSIPSVHCHYFYSFSHKLHLGQVVAGVFCCPLSAMHAAGPASTFT